MNKSLFHVNEQRMIVGVWPLNDCIMLRYIYMYEPRLVIIAKIYLVNY